MLAEPKPLSLQIQRAVAARIPNNEGEFQLVLYENNLDGKEHMALVHGDVNGRENVLVRVHSECFTGDVLGSLRCDCGEQLQQAIGAIATVVACKQPFQERDVSRHCTRILLIFLKKNNNKKAAVWQSVS